MAIGTGAAILGGAALSGGASYMAGKEQADATKKASRQEKKRLAQLLPYLTAGKEALGQFQGNIDQMPQYADILAGIGDDPGYQFQLDQGMNAIQGSAAARNNLLSGRTLRGLTEFGQQLGTGYADQAYNRELGAFQNQQNQLQALMQGGLSAGGAQSNLPQITMAGGQAQANAIGGIANAGTSALSNLYLSSLLKPPSAGFAGFTPTPASQLAIPSLNMNAYGG
jgi:hypothetical protein